MHFRLFVLGLYGLAVVVSMIMPNTGALPDLPFGDKMAHVLIFTGFGLISSWSAPKKHVTVITGSLLFAGLTEVVQWYLPYRRFDVWDFGADVLGILMGFVAYQAVRASSTRVFDSPRPG